MILNFLWIVIAVYGIISSFRLFKVVKTKKKKLWTILYTIFAGAYSLTAIAFSVIVAYATATEPEFNVWNLWFK
ncbi:MAG: hypothetical protein K2K06_02320 [Oscillospiraceae bacterium]|nr:hypothetical protein [Oscillospiraceae bacterium]